MNVLFVTKALNNHGGAERVIATEIRYLAQQGHDVSVMTPQTDQDVLIDYDIPDEITIHETQREGIIPDGRRVRRRIENKSIDLVKSHYRNKESYAGVLLSTRDPLFYIHVHGTVLWFNWDWGSAVHKNKSCVKNLFESVPGHREFDNRPDLSRWEYYKTKAAEYIEGRAITQSKNVNSLLVY